ncbi:MAG: hypothetical protein Q4E57_08115 [Eubacteriales bacterium]|nr:hypothetical protein [Eubacteriales bacterium]
MNRGFIIKKIYLDMDGVLADFDRGKRELCEPGIRPKWDGIRKVPHFYDRLELMPGAKEMFDEIYGLYGDKCEILTGIPKPHQRIEHAAEDKIAWAHRLLSENVVVHTVLKEEKKNFVTGPDCVLIDDHQPNIDDWVRSGGTGILFTDAEAALAELRYIEMADR